MAGPAQTPERSRLVDDASTAKISRTLAHQAFEAAAAAAEPRLMLAAWHKYVKARAAETAAEDALFSYDLDVAMKAGL